MAHDVHAVRRAAIFVVAAVLKWMPESDVWRRTRTELGGRGVDLRAILEYRRIFALLFVVVLLNSEAYWFTYTWMPGYLELKRGLTAVAASHLLIKMQIGGVLGYLTFGRVADRFGRRPAFSAYGLLMAAGTIPPNDSVEHGSGSAGAHLGRDVHGRIRHRHLGRNRADDRRIAGRREFAHVAWITAERNARLPVLHADFDRSTRRTLRFRRNAVARRRLLTMGALLVWILPETRGCSITALD